MKSTKKFGVLLLLSLLNGCANISGIECAWADVITVSKDDVFTRETAEQIVAHNEKVKRFCK